ncbi:hypothetical protein [Treponema zioleckii]|uniref:hypothetical protein n=1 Tax=Treponema zioleckii TaxID=331680 RepID=UPI00168B3489|nr:hypothetical protein [Treponema zioleckii]
MTSDCIFIVIENLPQLLPKITKFNTKTKKVEKEIFVGKPNSTIYDFDTDETGFVFNVMNLGKKKSQDIYHFDYKTEKLTKITKEPINITDAFFSCYPRVSGDFIFYLQQDLKNKVSSIVGYRLSDGNKRTIKSVDFSKLDTFIGISFLEIDDTILLHDEIGKKTVTLFFYDFAPDVRRIIKKVSAPKTTLFHYNAKYDRKTGNAVLYAKTRKHEDFLYKINMKTGQIDKLISFNADATINNDQFYYNNEKLVYAVKRVQRDKNKIYFYGTMHDSNLNGEIENKINILKNTFCIVQSGLTLALLEMTGSEKNPVVHLVIRY